MSGKLIMKRKLDRTQQPSNNNKVDESSASSSNSVINKPDKQFNKSDEAFLAQPDNKRIRCDTPPSESEDLDLPPLPQVNEQNRHLLEAIQLKILELQNELDAFEHDVEAREEDYYLNDNHNIRQSNQMTEEDAEALGFAMCAQETMLFLQREGIPSDSLLYTRLHDALVGRSQTDRVFQL